MPEEFNPETHIIGDDGKIYEKRIVSATVTFTGSGLIGLDQEASPKENESSDDGKVSQANP